MYGNSVFCFQAQESSMPKRSNLYLGQTFSLNTLSKEENNCKNTTFIVADPKSVS